MKQPSKVLEEPILSRDEVEALEYDTRRKYSGETAVGYSADTVSRRLVASSGDFFNRLLEIRLNLAGEHARGARVLDLGCATGTHLMELGPVLRSGVGIDFSFPLVKRACENHSVPGQERLCFLEGNARSLPFRDASFDFVYSFSSLYYMPNVNDVVREIARVLVSGGRCLLEMGNSRSLNAVVADAYPELARSFHLTVSRMKLILREAGLGIVSHRSFQILPYWGERPDWLAPALWGGWRKLFEKQIEGRMLDEWVCSLPGLRSFAFRHLFVCKKA